ncbi:S1 family peptidase [Limnospira fusiformis]|uniref:Serine protease n=2 Tax=Sirenicapillariaceae TaxID=2934961 RepID=A0A9P1P078_9CYAN|nr:hypothetical protein (exported) [Limnospira indica PCC 8005]
MTKMRSLTQNLLLLAGVSLLATLAPAALAALSPAEINSIASQTTVLIAPELRPELIEALENNYRNPLASQNNPDGVWHPGSGVIIAREGNRHYVLTVSHNFRQRDLNAGISYGIRTSDGKVHIVQQPNDGRGCPLNGSPTPGNLMRFGCYSISLPTRVDGPDLAVVVFESDHHYPVAPSATENSLNVGDPIYVSGWPDPEKERDATTGRCLGRAARRQRRFTWGPVTGVVNPASSENGYSIFYLDNTRPGMSGGPVFDKQGRVVGVHGRGSAGKAQLVNRFCSVSNAPNAQAFESGDFAIEGQGTGRADPEALRTRFSSGQAFNNFIGLIRRTGLNLSFNTNPPPPQMIQFALTAIPAGSSTGTVDFAIGSVPVGSFDDPQDVIPNIYDSYSSFEGLGSRLRDTPSGGCDSLLLGEPCW